MATQINEIIQTLNELLKIEIKESGLRKLDEYDAYKQVSLIVKSVIELEPKQHKKLVEGILEKYHLGYWRPEAVKAREDEMQRAYNDMLADISNQEGPISRDEAKRIIADYICERQEDPKLFDSIFRRIIKLFKNSGWIY